MKRVNSFLAAAARDLGWPGIVGLALAVCVCVFYFSTLRAERSRLEALQQHIATVRDQSRLSDSAGPASASERLAAFYGFFPRPDELPDLLDRIFAVAKGQGLQLEHGDYRVVPDSTGELMQFQLTLPVRGTYPQIRNFVDGAMLGVSTLSLDSIQFERQKVGESTLDAKVKMALYVGKKS